MMDGNVPPSGAYPRTGIPTAMAPDDDTVATPTRGDKSRPNDQSLEEKTIKFRFPAPVSSGDPIPPHVLHVHWMQDIQQAFGPQVQFFDNANHKVPVIDPIRVEATGAKMNFKLHGRPISRGQTKEPPLVLGDRRATKYITIHRIKTSFSIADLKADPHAQKMLRDHDFYVNEHRWSEDEWDTLQIGFMFGIDPTYYGRDQATAKMTAEIVKLAPAHTKISKFKLLV